MTRTQCVGKNSRKQQKSLRGKQMLSAAISANAISAANIKQHENIVTEHHQCHFSARFDRPLLYLIPPYLYCNSAWAARDWIHQHRSGIKLTPLPADFWNRTAHICITYEIVRIKRSFHILSVTSFDPQCPSGRTSQAHRVLYEYCTVQSNRQHHHHPSRHVSHVCVITWHHAM